MGVVFVEDNDSASVGRDRDVVHRRYAQAIPVGQVNRKRRERRSVN